MTGFERWPLTCDSGTISPNYISNRENACYIPYKNVLLNIVFHTYGIIFTAVSINIVDMNSNKQFLITHACTCTATALRQHVASALWRVCISVFNCSVSNTAVAVCNSSEYSQMLVYCRFFVVEFKNNDRRSILSCGGRQKYQQQNLLAGIKAAAQTPHCRQSVFICILHLDTDRKYNATDIFHAVSFCGIIGNHNKGAISV